MKPPSTPPQSPCMQVCFIDPESNLCIGCLRTRKEIAQWRDACDNQKKHILSEIEKRKQPYV